ncbi:MAG: polysaccharide deacetylase family protein [Acidobacteria bacterium]|nr:polysaccharide deacetylase family protein [Acidobacteriota bacterium]
MLRALLKTGSCHVLRWTGIDRLKAACDGTADMPVVIGYHRVVADFAAEAKRSIPALLISVSMFQQHLDWLERHYDLVSLDHIGATLRDGSRFAHPVAAITFDDAYRDNFLNAFPILQDRKIPSAMFVPTDVIGASAPLIHDELYRLTCLAFPHWHEAASEIAAVLAQGAMSAVDAEMLGSVDGPFAALRLMLPVAPQELLRRVARVLERFIPPDQDVRAAESLTWEMLAEMQRCGVTIGSHTRTHVILNNEDRRRVQEELEGSRRVLQEKLKTSVAHFSYPDGGFNAETVRAVASAGYSFAYTTCGRRDPAFPMFTIPRRLLWERSCINAENSFSGAVMGCHLNGVFDLLTSCGHHHGDSVGSNSGTLNTRKAGWAHS